MGERISYEDARMMYKDTLCDYKGDLVFVSNISPEMETLFREVGTTKLKRVQFDTDDFSAPASGRMGYVNFGVVAAYVMRNPRRMYKNGLNHENMKPVVGGEIGFAYTDGELDYINMMLMRPMDGAFQETYNGVFPSFEEAIERVSPRASRLVAFDRQFALSYKGGVYYKNQLVGEINLKTGKSLADVKWKDGWETIMMLATNEFKLGQ